MVSSRGHPTTRISRNVTRLLQSRELLAGVRLGNIHHSTEPSIHCKNNNGNFGAAAISCRAAPRFLTECRFY
jgi:hypothetical protein